jgi:hypothetical protein
MMSSIPVPPPSVFFQGLVEHIDKFASSHDKESLPLIHEGVALCLDYFALQTIHANPKGDHSETMVMSECFLEHVDLFYSEP